MDFHSLLSFQTNAEYTVSSTTYENNELTVSVDFLTDLETEIANLTLSFNQLLISHKPINLQFTIKSTNYPLIIFNHYSLANLMKQIVLILVIFTVFLFFLGSWSHKMIGV